MSPKETNAKQEKERFDFLLKSFWLQIEVKYKEYKRKLIDNEKRVSPSQMEEANTA